MKDFFRRILSLLGGLLLYSTGIIVTMKAQIGYAPWDVFHVGFANTAGLSIGFATILTGLILVVVSLVLGEKIGVGTILNMLLIGIFMDIILGLGLIPTASSPIVGAVKMIIGLFIISMASFLYIGSGFGAGPRDSLMVALTRLTKLPVGVCRGGIELAAVLVGWRLGGMVGFGTLLSAVLIGFCVELTFKLMRFDPTVVQHETIDRTIKRLVPSKEAS